MYEEKRKFNWIDFFIKGIIVVIILLFIVWLLSLSNKGVNDSLNVLTDNIFNENIQRMKEVGKDYFTIERLPQKVGEVETLSLKEMYDKKLILEVKDKYGKACSADKSYVSIEKLENEYNMKVYLECSDKSDYINVIMGCYDYCDGDICEQKKPSSSEGIEYEYKKTTGGKWTDYGAWSEWSNVSVTKTDYREVETKVVKENYTYDKTIYENDYVSFETSCPKGYSKTTDGTRCYKKTLTPEYKNPNKCADTYNEYSLVSQNGFTCNYSKSVNYTVAPNACANTYNEYSLVNQNGFTCNYSKSSPYTATPSCPSSYNGYSYYGRDGLTCKYSKKVIASIDYVYNCDSSCGMKPVYTYKYEYTTGMASCPSGTNPSNGTCIGYSLSYETTSVGCPSGYLPSGNSCVRTGMEYTNTVAGCPSGYDKTSDGTKCYKNVPNTKYENIITSCPSGYDKTDDGSRCYKEVPSVVKVTGTRDVVYYRYRIREYIGGTVDYKWSKSKEDKKLLDAGYTLTGRTR